MTRLRGTGDKLNRAQSIIGSIGKKEEVKPELPPVDGITPVEQPEIVDEGKNNEVAEGLQEPVVEKVQEDIPPQEPQKAEEVKQEPVIETPALSEIPDDVILSKLSETLGRKINSFDDLKQKEIDVDPELKQLIEWKEKTGLSLSQWSEYNKDFSKMGDLEVAREILSQKYPNFTKEELEFEMSNLVYNEDYDDESDKMRKSIALKKLATEGRKTLESKKLELKPVQYESLTKEQQDAVQYAEQVKLAEANAKKNQEAYESNLNLAARNLKTIPIELEDGVKIEHIVEDKDKNNLKDFILNVPQWFKEDGTPNYSNIASDGYKIKNFDAIIKAAYEQGKAVQKEAEIKGKGNLVLDTTGKPQGQGEAKKGNLDEIVSKLTGSNSNKFRFRKKTT